MRLFARSNFRALSDIILRLLSGIRLNHTKNAIIRSVPMHPRVMDVLRPIWEEPAVGTSNRRAALRIQPRTDAPACGRTDPFFQKKIVPVPSLPPLSTIDKTLYVAQRSHPYD
ncbi:hypothetical protein EWH08_00200 [Sphingobium indicum]|uniref:Uncharacterized protein n=1 Tax=Sphingobium indicum TaxID=332055 RepID=A0A4Q4JBA5_9SPHN|nr:hypothetical protein EWH08_00200 [Sphingobium indicum]